MAEGGESVRVALARRALSGAGIVWFMIAAAGQLAFVYFVLTYYGTRTASGNFSSWNDKPLIDGYIEGDIAGNVMFGVHTLMAMVITLGGLLQLVPQIRSAAPAFHRWNGRIYIVVAYVMALGGLWLGWVRGTQLSLVSSVALSLNAVLILVFATLAWRQALARRIDHHRRWAMRTFMAVSGVWFLRVALMAWIILNQGPVGMNETLSGPADTFLVFGSYLIPLAVLEAYFAAQRNQRALVKVAVAALLLAMTGVTAVGAYGTVTILWGPYL